MLLYNNFIVAIQGEERKKNTLFTHSKNKLNIIFQ